MDDKIEIDPMNKSSWSTKLPLSLILCVALAGCRSRFVEVTIVNQGPAVHVMEFDYPSASFGANSLPTGAKYNYRFKIQGSGPLSLQFEDTSGRTHTAQGPNVDLGDQGSLLVNIGPSGAVAWTPTLTNPK
jgi:hypothetical protein